MVSPPAQAGAGQVDLASASSPASVPARKSAAAPAPVTVFQPRRSARHVVAGDGGVATDEDTLSRAMKRKAALNDTAGQE